jgi:hypothetical protein
MKLLWSLIFFFQQVFGQRDFLRLWFQGLGPINQQHLAEIWRNINEDISYFQIAFSTIKLTRWIIYIFQQTSIFNFLEKKLEIFLLSHSADIMFFRTIVGVQCWGRVINCSINNLHLHMFFSQFKLLSFCHKIYSILIPTLNALTVRTLGKSSKHFEWFFVFFIVFFFTKMKNIQFVIFSSIKSFFGLIWEF